MNYYGAAELAASFRTVRKNTIIIAEEIGDEHYAFRATPETRTVAQTLAHLALIPQIQMQIHGERLTTLAGFNFPAIFAGIIQQEQAPRSKEQIIAMLRENGEKFASWIESLPEDVLAERVTYPPGMTPPTRSRFEMILGVKEHEMHHRAQLMLVERMLGIVPHLTREMQARMAAAQTGKASA